MKYMLDTNICIYITKRKPRHVFDRFKQHQVGDIGISSITYAELQYGVQKSLHVQQNAMALANFVAPLVIHPFTAEAGLPYGVVRSGLEQDGNPIGPMDLLIAAHAKQLEHTLVTNNSREFARVRGLQIENWATMD